MNASISDAVMAAMASGPGAAPVGRAGMEPKPAISSPLAGSSGLGLAPGACDGAVSGCGVWTDTLRDECRPTSYDDDDSSDNDTSVRCSDRTTATVDDG